MSRVAGPAGRLEARMRELLAENAKRDAVLKRERDGRGERVHQAGDSGTLLGHADKDFARLPVRVEADGDVALMSGERELVCDRRALGGQAMTNSSGWGLRVGRVGVDRERFGDLAELSFKRSDAELVRRSQRGDDGFLDLDRASGSGAQRGGASSPSYRHRSGRRRSGAGCPWSCRGRWRRP